MFGFKKPSITRQDSSPNTNAGTGADNRSIYSQSSSIAGSSQNLPIGEHQNHPKSAFSQFFTGSSNNKEEQDERNRRYRERKTQNDLIKDRYKQDSIKWFSLRKLSDVSKENDSLTYSPARLNSFLQFYDTYIQQNSIENMRNVINLVDFWSISAIKYLSGVDQLIRKNLVARYSNSDLREDQKLKILKIHGDYFGISWSWLLAMDNWSCDIYSLTTTPITHTNYSESKSNIGPKNHHVVHGKSLSTMPFKKNSYPLAIAYELWFQLKIDEWNPVLTDLHRVISPSGYLNMFLMDYTIINCKNELYNEFFKKLQKIVINEGMDPFPCKNILKRTKEAGFIDVKYSLISIKKGIPNRMGNLMEFIQSFFELAMFSKFARDKFSQNDLQLFKELRLQYNQDVKNGKLLDEFGDSYLMFVTAKKSSNAE
ncbi:hypothetical protein BN7_946 [Wickerhamomyces ciferrii]|uniref:Uncharacterized protein n=1 Tax=Wickerhamomyces ciferrii (strain ATCC 14091 / BCRC 22168 / CBS 111 / JCM 3599 / NBRC 0793 / NRRL Y-1031 F-60-10) TaxID=1206466 RepID=K0K941_WICCF|nr:uncharacterized protein BN7_946 [Wickerhamomyces ciferrii]CCH41405.1 hypothetical protein BN7_946 [Wickerhamomyces ciferrii]